MEARSLGEVTDPLDNTLLVLEADPEDVEWLEPRDILFEDAMEMLETVDTLAVSVRPDTDFFYHCPILNHPGGRIATLADGSPMFFTHRHSVDYWKSLLTIDDGITPDPKYRREPRTPRRLKVGNTLRLGLFLFLALLPLPWVWLGRPA